MLLSINENKLFCKKTFLFLASRFLPTDSSLLGPVSVCVGSGAAQSPRMCRCTYCKDVYVGLIRSRVIYLPKDRHVILEISGEIYLKYVAFLFSPPFFFRC